MRDAKRLTLLHKVALLFYREGKTKDEISKIIGKTSTTVKNLLNEAEDEGIVNITINRPRLQVMQEQLRSHFHHLRDVIVIPHEADVSVLLKNLGEAAAEYFEDKVTTGARIALGGGYLMYEMISMLPARLRDIHILPAAIIGRGPTIAHIDPMILVTLLWAKSGRLQERAHYVTVTPFDGPGMHREVRRHYLELLKRSKVRELFDEMKQVDWLFASIGGLNPDPAYVSAIHSSTRNLMYELKFKDNELRQEGVVGDLAYSFFDADGNPKPTLDVAGSLGIKQLRQMAADPSKGVVVVVGGYKMQALRAVLRGELCNVLITDARAAEGLLSK